jgi:DNA-binding IclR family transcriptional regulator
MGALHNAVTPLHKEKRCWYTATLYRPMAYQCRAILASLTPIRARWRGHDGLCYDSLAVMAARNGGIVGDRDGSIQSVRRALQLLSNFTQQRPQWSVGELSRATGLHKSVVTRLMATMALDGFVVQDRASRVYTIGPQAFAIGNVYGPYTILDRIARPIMEELTRISGHACALGVPTSQQFMYLIVIEGPRSTPIRVTIEVGGRRPYHAAAIGKVLLANMPPERVAAILGDGPLVKVTPYTIDSPEHLLSELASIRQTGIAYSRQEAIIGAGAVATGITNAYGRCIAGLNVTYPIHLVTDEETAELGRLTLEAARKISQQVGRLALEPDVWSNGEAGAAD